MKYRARFYLSSFLFFSFFLAQGNVKTTPANHSLSSPQFNNYNNHQIYFDNKNISKNKNKSTQTTITVLTLVKQIRDYAKSFDPEPYKKYTRQWFKKNRRNIIRYSIVSCYITICLFLLAVHYYLHQPNSWSQWQASVSLTELCTRPQQLLQQELIFDIQKRYLNQQNPTDFISPFVTFMNKITVEEKYINRYIALLNSIHRVYLGRLFLINEKKIREIELSKQRLIFVRQVFSSWAAEYNINQYHSNKQEKEKQSMIH